MLSPEISLDLLYININSLVKSINKDEMRLKEVKLNSPLDINIAKLSGYLEPAGIHYSKLKKSETIRLVTNTDSFIILKFNKETEEGFIQIHSFYNPYGLAFILQAVPEEVLAPLLEALKGTKFELPKLSKEKNVQLIKDSEERLRIMAERDEIINKANSVGQLKKRGNFSHTNARSVLIHGVGYTDSKSTQYILASYEPGFCVTVAIYNPNTKTASLANFDSTTCLTSLDDMCSKLKGKDDNNKLQVHLRGNELLSNIITGEVINWIYRKKYLDIKSCDLGISYLGLGGKSLAIDARTGEVYTEFLLY